MRLGTTVNRQQAQIGPPCFVSNVHVQDIEGTVMRPTMATEPVAKEIVECLTVGILYIPL